MFNLLPAEQRANKRIRRAYQRFMLGSDMPGKYRLITLTTPEEYDGDFHRDWRRLVERMHRRGIPREYFAVKEFNKKHTCKHLHVAMRLSWIDYMILREQWNQITGARWIHVDKINNQKHMCRYLCKYLNKCALDEPGVRSYWCSYQWIYRKFARFSKDMWKYGHPLSKEEHELYHSIPGHYERLCLMNSELLNAFYECPLDEFNNVLSLIQYPFPN